MKKGKFTSLMLAGMMAVTTLAGCGSGGKQAASKVVQVRQHRGSIEYLLLEYRISGQI